MTFGWSSVPRRSRKGGLSILTVQAKIPSRASTMNDRVKRLTEFKQGFSEDRNFAERCVMDLAKCPFKLNVCGRPPEDTYVLLLTQAWVLKTLKVRRQACPRYHLCQVRWSASWYKLQITRRLRFNMVMSLHNKKERESAPRAWLAHKPSLLNVKASTVPVQHMKRR